MLVFLQKECSRNISNYVNMKVLSLNHFKVLHSCAVFQVIASVKITKSHYKNHFYISNKNKINVKVNKKKLYKMSHNNKEYR